MELLHFCYRNPHLGNHSRLTLFPQKFFLHGLEKSHATLLLLRRKEGLRIVIHTVRDARTVSIYITIADICTAEILHQQTLSFYSFRRLLHFLVGADPDLLTKCSKAVGSTAENLNRFWNSSSFADLLDALRFHPPTQHPVTLRPKHYIPWILRLIKVTTTWQFAPKVDTL